MTPDPVSAPEPWGSPPDAADGGPPPALRAAGLGFRFPCGGAWALRDCSFTVPSGSVTALVGPNGAGKSTLLQLATDLRRPTEGGVRVFGAPAGTWEARRRTAFLAQDKPLYARFTVEETLRVGRELNTAWDQEAAERLVRAAGIRLDARVGALSPGRRTRVALALVLGKRPGLLLLDEPLADLDPLVREEVMSVLMAEAAEREITVVLSSHVLPDLEHTCDHVLLLHEGRVRLEGNADALRAGHAVVTGPTEDGEPEGTVHLRSRGRQFTALVQAGDAGVDAEDDWIVERPSLEDVLLGHLRAAYADTADALDCDAPEEAAV